MLPKSTMNRVLGQKRTRHPEFAMILFYQKRPGPF